VGVAATQGTRPSAAAAAEPANTRLHVGVAATQGTRPSAAAAAEPANTRLHVGVAAAHTRPSAMSTGEPATRGGHVGTTRLDVAELCAEAKVALKQMGWKPAIAQAAVRAAASMLGEDATLQRVLVEALRQCPRPSIAAPVVSTRADSPFDP
jgi:hypothetical protein